uniref:Uncharacterized protein n=1 Tax=Rhizophora mucronata TaxID=61149 RepID=A0A2P2LEC3_RHIMU
MLPRRSLPSAGSATLR